MSVAVFSRTTEILVTGDEADGAQILSWFDKIGPDYARWLNTPYIPIDRHYGDDIVDVCRSAAVEVDGKRVYPHPFLVAAMIAHEAAGGQSQFFRERNNPSGIGAINSAPGQALWFDTPRMGIEATVNRLLVYTVGLGPWKDGNPGAPRWQIIEKNGWDGIVTVLHELEQRWAFTPWDDYEATPMERRYGAMIAVLANDLYEWVDAGTNDRPRIATPNWRPCFIDIDAGNRPGLALAYEWVTFHDTDNRTYGADEPSHCNYVRGDRAASIPASWHGTIGDSGFWQHLPWTEVAWHAADGYSGPGNRSSLALESTVDDGQRFDIARVNWVHGAAWALDQRSLGIERLVQHNHWKSNAFPTGKNCPRWLRETGGWDPFVADVNAMLQNVKPEQPVLNDPNARLFDETGFWVINTREVRMLDLWAEFGGLNEPDPVGYPLSGMTLDEDGVYRQLFDNRLLEVWPDGRARSGGIGQRYVRLLEAA